MVAGLQRIRLEQDAMRTKAEYSCKIAANPKYFSKNRYRDIIPCKSHSERFVAFDLAF